MPWTIQIQYYICANNYPKLSPNPPPFLKDLPDNCTFYGNLEISFYTQRRVHQTNVILQYKLVAAILSAVCSVIQQS